MHRGCLREARERGSAQGGKRGEPGTSTSEKSKRKKNTSIFLRFLKKEIPIDQDSQRGSERGIGPARAITLDHLPGRRVYHERNVREQNEGPRLPGCKGRGELGKGLLFLVSASRDQSPMIA